jgi:hypothetical protein
MSLDKIQKLVGSLTKSLEDNEKIITPILAAKLAKCVKENPYDQTIGSMSVVIEKMAENNQMFIRRADLKNLYNKLYSRNTKFAELFQDELGALPQASQVVTMQHDDSSEINAYDGADPILANALQSVFDNSIPLKMYSQDLADKAKASVAFTLDNWNLRASSVEITDGNEKFIIVKANYETPKGITGFYVPVEINKNKIVEATHFMGNGGPQELDYRNIRSYLTSSAGTKLKVTGSGILNVLTTATAENREISDAEFALTRLNASRKETSDFFANQIVGQTINESTVNEVKLDKYADEFSFEKNFTSPYGQASFVFGTDKVNIARANISRELTSFGHRNSQVSVSKVDDNTIYYAVSLDSGKVAFTVPVKVNNGNISKPTFMMCNGSLAPFEKENINQLYVNNQSDYKAAAVASTSYGLKPHELINEIKISVAAANLSKAEDCLNVLANCGDSKLYAIGFQAFVDGLSNEKVAEPTQCSKLIKNSTSEHAICSHTGLPSHKVFQDKYGNCQPLYRKGMDEAYEGATFLNAKIFG